MPRPKESSAAKFAVATDIIDLTEEHDAIVSDHDNGSAPDPKSGAIATSDADEDDDAMPDALESAIVQSWLQRHEGTDAAGGGEDLELELEMQELAEGRHDAEDAEKEEDDEQEEEMEEVLEEDESMHSASDDPLEIEG